MIKLVPFQPWHAEAMQVQDAQMHEANLLKEQLPTVTIIKDDLPLLVGGVVEMWKGRAMVTY